MSPRFEVRPLGLWDRPVTAERKVAQFRSGWNETIALLLHEVELLDGGMVVVQVDTDVTMIRRDGMLRAGAKVSSPAVKISFDSRHGALTYATDAFTDWRANVRGIALGLTALRAVDRYGITRSGEQYRGWTAIADKPYAHGGEMTVEEAEAALREAAGLDAETGNFAYPNAIMAAFRMAARIHHPDVPGGSDIAFQVIVKARDVLLAAARGGEDR